MEAVPNKSEREQVMDFIRLCLRHWYYFIVSGAVCLIIAWIYLKTATPVYQVEASVALRHDESLTGSVGKQSSGLLSAIGLGRGSENIEDETIKMSSQGNIKQVVKAFDLNKVYTLVGCWGLSKEPLYDHSPVLLSVDPAIADTLTDIVAFQLHVDKTGRGKLKVKYGNYKSRFTIDSFPATVSIPCADFTLSVSPEYAACKKPFDLEILYTNYDYITQIYRKLIAIDFHKKNSDLISLVMHSPNPDRSKKLIWATVDSYNKNWDAEKDYVYKNTISYMNQRLAENTLALSEADRQIQRFKDQYQLTDIEADVKFYYLQSAETQKELLAVATKINVMEIVRDFLQNEANRYGLIPFTVSNNDDKSVNLVIEKYNEAMVQRNVLRKNQPQSPSLWILEEQLDSQRKNLIVTINKEMEGLQVTLANIKRKDAEVNRKIGAVPLVEREYIHLKREQELQQSIYIFLLEKREELGIRSVSLMPKLKMINEPFVANKPVSPKLFKTLLTALFFGGVLIPLSLIYGLPYVRTLRRKNE
ncbi:MAG: hypothetical protein LBH19_12700 [Dysgonamonadaceae bacterium]|jgi:uncharacterized protein involved in exopolysaccharide biosynthesis|nr:hypothetical protein [Dysgonamonadaceae bacterium]